MLDSNTIVNRLNDDITLYGILKSIIIEEFNKHDYLKNILPFDGIEMEIDNIFTIYLKNKTQKFAIDPVKQMCVSPESDILVSNFDYFQGSKVASVDGEEKYEYDKNLSPTDWSLITRLDNFLEYAKEKAYTSIMTWYYCAKGVSPSERIYHLYGRDRYKVGKLAECYKKVHEDDSFMITKRTIDAIKSIYEEELCSIARLSNENGLEYDIVAYPNYGDGGKTIVLFTQIGYPKSGYDVGLEEKDFFLVIDPITCTCKYSWNFPWIENPKDLFGFSPEDSFDGDDSVHGEIMIAVSNLFSRIRNYELSIEDMYSNNKDEIGLTPKPSTVEKFVNALKDKITLNYDVTPDTTYVLLPNGLARVFIGFIVIDVSVESCGLVDIAVTRELKPEDVWPEIFQWGNAKPTIVDSVDPLFKHFLTYEKCTSLESKTIMEDIGNTVMAVMSQEMRGDDNT